MGLILVAEIADRCQNGVRGRLTQPAQCAVLDTLAELFQQLHIALFALALADAVEDLQNTRRFDAGMTQQLLQHLGLHPTFNRSCGVGMA